MKIEKKRKNNYWTIPCDINYYNIEKAFNNLNVIDWKQNLKNIKIGDVVYIYVGVPYSKIMYKCIVNKINLDNVTIDDREYWSNPEDYGKFNKYMEIKLLKKYDNINYYHYNNLILHGFNNRRSQSSASIQLVNYLEIFSNSNIENENYELVNKKRVKDKNLWLKVLNNEQQIDNLVLDILFYLYDCKNYTSNGKAIAYYFHKDVGAINGCISGFGKRVIDLLHLKEQTDNKSHSKRWNIPFETVPELNNKNLFTWRLRQELVDALVEKYDLYQKEDTLDEIIKQFMEDYPYDKFLNDIQKDLKAREKFVHKFTINSILQLSIDDFVIGRSELDDKGKESFCYLIERSMIKLGDMRGSYVSKFGVWYNKKNNMYDHSKIFGSNFNEAFENLKKEIRLLLDSAKNDDYEKIKENKIAPIFKGKILSTYFPEKYLCIFKEEDVDKFLNILNINYDIREIDTFEKKKMLLKEYRSVNKHFRDKDDYYFVVFLYTVFRKELKVKNTVSGQINSDLEFVNFEYCNRHFQDRRIGYRSRQTDYDRINRNKKDVGTRGEDAILQYEKDKLRALGLSKLSQKVCKCDNDAIGYDINSFDENGNEIHIEVKTNSSNTSYLDFYISDNELQHLKEDNNYYIYYLYNIKKKPKCHIINKKVLLEKEQDFFQPVIYKVSIDVLKK